MLLASRCTATATEKKRSPLRAGRSASVVELPSGGCICRARINIAQHAARIEGKTSAARRVFRYSGRTTAGLALHRVSAGQRTKLDGVRALLAIREQTSLSSTTTSATSTEYKRRKQRRRRRRRQNLDPEESNEIERSCSSQPFNVFKLVDGSRGTTNDSRCPRSRKVLSSRVSSHCTEGSLLLEPTSCCFRVRGRG